MYKITHLLNLQHLPTGIPFPKHSFQDCTGFDSHVAGSKICSTLVDTQKAKFIAALFFHRKEHFSTYYCGNQENRKRPFCFQLLSGWIYMPMLLKSCLRSNSKPTQWYWYLAILGSKLFPFLQQLAEMICFFYTCWHRCIQITVFSYNRRAFPELPHSAFIR